MATKQKGPRFLDKYNQRNVEDVTTTGALSVDVPITNLHVTSTVEYTLAGPKFAGQWKLIQVVEGASTPVANVTVTGMRNATQNVWALATFVAASAPRAIELYSPDGLVWDCIGIVSPGSATGVTVS
jgi:hypothetical protein